MSNSIRQIMAKAYKLSFPTLAKQNLPGVCIGCNLHCKGCCERANGIAGYQLFSYDRRRSGHQVKNVLNELKKFTESFYINK